MLETLNTSIWHSTVDGKSDIDTIGDAEFTGNVFGKEFMKHLADNYSSLNAFVADWSPIAYWYFTTYTKKAKEKSATEKVTGKVKELWEKTREGMIGEIRKYAAREQKELDEFLIKYPNARSVYDSLINVGDLKKPEPVTEPVSTVTYETLTSQEVAYYISTNLKGTIPSKTTTNADNSVDVFVNGQTEAIATIIKQNGEVTIK